MSRIGRKNDELRDVRITRDFCPAADGSVLMQIGMTRVICAASVSGQVPDHARERGLGWITAEYTLLPYSTRPRKERRAARPDGRSVEIQRLIGRSLRSAVDLSRLQNFLVTLDCDVLQADGGTRTAAITGGYIAMKIALRRLVESKALPEDPIVTPVAAVSVGFVNGEILLDLDYEEDSSAEVDMNVVMDGSMKYVEIQGAGEGATFNRNQLDGLLFLAGKGVTELMALQERL